MFSILIATSGRVWFLKTFFFIIVNASISLNAVTPHPRFNGKGLFQIQTKI